MSVAGELAQRAEAMRDAKPIAPGSLRYFVVGLELTGYLPLGSLACLTDLLDRAGITSTERIE